MIRCGARPGQPLRGVRSPSGVAMARGDPWPRRLQIRVVESAPSHMLLNGREADGNPVPAQSRGERDESLVPFSLAYSDSPVIVCADLLVALLRGDSRRIKNNDDSAGIIDEDADGWRTSDPSLAPTCLPIWNTSSEAKTCGSSARTAKPIRAPVGLPRPHGFGRSAVWSCGDRVRRQ